MKKWLKTENGFTLVEVLASILLLTLVIVTFMMMFALGARTHMTSKELFNSTYEVQNEMEKMVELSAQAVTSSARITAIKESLGYTPQAAITESGVRWGRLTKKVGTEHVMEIRLEETTSPFVRIIVEVAEEGNINEKVKMETLLTWEGVDP